VPATPSLLTPVILSGGAGTRLWPLSRASRPKQFLPLAGERTLFAQTVARPQGIANSGPPIIVGNATHAALIAAEAGDDAQIILEPCARNTAPAIALAALLAAPNALLLVMPSDHVIADILAFHTAIQRARLLAEAGWLVTFGIEPDGPETGYGYIALGETVGDGVQAVTHFVEKPDVGRAREMLAQGNHVWNAGIFLFSAQSYLDALAQHQPAMLVAAQAAMAGAVHDGNQITPDATAFATAPSDSIDYAVMERASKVACTPVNMGWSDVGSWDSLHAIADKDAANNSVSASSLLIESQGCLVRSDKLRITLVGVDDLIVVASGDDVLILPRGKAQDVRKAVAARGPE
jgi:mannose-1-phosphate guanylyltransferase